MRARVAGLLLFILIFLAVALCHVLQNELKELSPGL
jgi:hypothetical protein